MNLFNPLPARSRETLYSVRMADSVMRRHPVLSREWHYTFGLVLSAFWQVWQNTGTSRYFDYLKENVDRLVTETGVIKDYAPNEYNIDHINSGKVLFGLYRVTGQKHYRQAIFALRNQLAVHPRTSEGGFWHKKIYPNQLWLDGIYMAQPFYAQFASVFGEAADFDDVAAQIILIAQHTKDSQTGLFYHGWDESKTQAWSDPITGCSASFWSRAIGWYAMAIIDVLDFFPAAHPQYDTLLRIFQDLMTAVCRYQDHSGLWFQIMDQGKRMGNYLEASASSMFVYALAKGLRQHRLPQTLSENAVKGYYGILHRLIHSNLDGSLHLEQICKVAGLGRCRPDQLYRDGSYDYYLREPIVRDDHRGVGPFILAAGAMEELMDSISAKS